MIKLLNVRNWPQGTAMAARFLVVLGIAMLAASLVMSWQSAAQDRKGASVSSQVSIEVPQDAKGSYSVMLELAVVAQGRSASKNVGGVVRLRRASGKPIEVGRFSLMPAGGGEAQRYKFDITGAIRKLDLSGGSLEVELSPVDRGNGRALADLVLAIASAQVETR